MRLVKENTEKKETEVLNVEQKANRIWADNVHKVIAYPIVCIVCYLFLCLCFFTFMPYVNSIGYLAFSSNVDNFIIYYPAFIVMDAAIAYAGWYICKVFAKSFTSFVKKLVDKSRERKANKVSKKKIK